MHIYRVGIQYVYHMYSVCQMYLYMQCVYSVQYVCAVFVWYIGAICMHTVYV